MPTIEKRLIALEKIHSRDNKSFTYQVVHLNKDDSPDEHEQKLRQIEEIEASGGRVFVIRVVEGMA